MFVDHVATSMTQQLETQIMGLLQALLLKTFQRIGYVRYAV